MTTPVEFEPEPSPADRSIELESAMWVRVRSFGAIRTAKLFDFEHRRFHDEGLFSERIFGPVADYCCACGMLCGSDNFGRVCAECGVQIRSNAVRGERIGHIEFPLPVLHPWFAGGELAPVESLLDLGRQQVRRLLARKLFLGQPNSSPQLCSAASNSAIAQLECEPTLDEFLSRSGPNAVQKVLGELKAGELLIPDATQLLEPENMVLDVVPVLPVRLRTIRLVPGGAIEIDRVTARYRRIVRRSQAVERCLSRMRSRGNTWPDREAIYQLARRERQLAREVSRLFAEIICRRPAPLYASRDRAAVVPDPTLPLFACRLPEELAEQLAVDDANEPKDGNPAHQFRQLQSEVAKRPVVLHLAEPGESGEPIALHPRVASDRAIHVHPLLAATLKRSTADLTAAVQAFSWLESESDCDRLSFPTVGLRDPVLGKCRLFPAVDAAVGCYYATWLAEDRRKLRDKAIAGELESRVQIPTFASLDDVRNVWERGRLQLRDLIGIQLPPEQKLYRKIRDRVDLRDGKPRVGTTVARAIVNSFLPQGFPYYDVEFDLTALIAIVKDVHDLHGDQDTIKFIERSTSFGLHVITRSGLSLSHADLLPPPSVGGQVAEAQKDIARLHRLEHRGIICPSEAWSKIYETSNAARDKSTDAHFREIDDGNSLHPLMAVLKGIGKLTNERGFKPVGILGNVWTPWQRNYPMPILRNINQGLGSHDYFRMAAVNRHHQVQALHVPAAPQRLQRQIAGAIGEVVISEEDCGTREGAVLARSQDNGIEHGTNQAQLDFASRMVGRVIVHGLVYFSEEGFAVRANDMITPRMASAIERSSYDEIKVRSPLYCRARKGICQRCYGADPATGRLIEPGAAVGIKATMAIGPALRALHELLSPPPADSTLREFMDADRGFSAARHAGVVSLRRLRVAVDRLGQRVVVSPGGVIEIVANDSVVDTAWVAHGALVNVAAGAQVQPKDNLATWDVQRQRVLAQDSGTVRIRRNHSGKIGYQLVSVHNAAGLAVDGCILPSDAAIHVRDADSVDIGALLAEYDRQEQPEPEFPGNHFEQLERLLTLEPPANRALLAESDGRVELCVDDGELHFEIRVHSNQPGEPSRFRLPIDQILNLLARTGQVVSAGDPLTRGKLSLADIVRIRGVEYVQSRLLATIDRLLADMKRDRPDDSRPWELLVAQMLRYVRVETGGDTDLQAGEVMLRPEVMATNAALANCVKIPDVGAYPVNLNSNVVGRVAYDYAEAQRRMIDPQSPPPGVSIPWPAGWSSMLMGIDDLTRQQCWITADGLRLSRAALVRAAITGRTAPVDRLQEAVLAGELMPAGSGWSRNDG